MILRRERPHPERNSHSSKKLTVGATKRSSTFTQIGQLAVLEARHRAHARFEDRIRRAKDTGLGRFLPREFAISQAWLAVTMIAADLAQARPGYQQLEGEKSNQRSNRLGGDARRVER